MGTFYAIGIVRDFTATANQRLSMEEWGSVLNDRLDLECFALTQNEGELRGKLDESIFQDQIVDFYHMLSSILGEKRNPEIDAYCRVNGTDINNYQIERTFISFTNEKGLAIKLHFKFAILFIEGKVLVEEFYTEPVLLNWLFRNSKIENKLSGCVVSKVVG